RTGSAAKAASGATDPSAVALTRPAPPSTAVVRRRRRFIVLLIAPSSRGHHAGAQAGGQAGDGAVRRRGQVDDPVRAAGRAAAGALTAEEGGLGTAVGDPGADPRAVAPVGGVVQEPAGPAGHVHTAAVRAGDRVAGVRGVRPGMLVAAGVAG